MYLIYFDECHFLTPLSTLKTCTYTRRLVVAMTQRNYVIAIIIIVLFVVLAAISFGIYKLVHGARRELTVTSESSSSGSNSLADER
ncbi:hypothetical protein Trco_004796 [Trichoderma cornu-damae]|uniref:Uncharacterized protein n=1 Tax=Trichoderma cornu-damae TaxID=654480 RepID=A0A9P8QM97_9HYPO|nr:hypothetical protein Trco_004796 [Trichoderma cornu-damae]